MLVTFLASMAAGVAVTALVLVLFRKPRNQVDHGPIIREKIRPNVLWLSVLVAAIATGLIAGLFLFLFGFIDEQDDFWTGAIMGSIVTLLVTLIGVCIGGLVSTMSTVAQESPPAAYPAEPFNRLLDLFLDKLDK